MTLSAALLIALVAGSTGGHDLCSGVENDIEPDMRILESDLTQSAAVEASRRLSEMIEHDELAGDFQMGALNQSRVTYGYLLARQARADRKEFGSDSAESRDSVSALCNWLSDHGFWYD